MRSNQQKGVEKVHAGGLCAIYRKTEGLTMDDPNNA